LDGSAGTTDPNGHGTAMAGLIAAATGNGIDIAGVGYSGVKVMPITVLGADGTGRDSDIIAGIVWAVDHGASVVSMSFSSPDYSTALQAAVTYAVANDVVVVAATGNSGSTTETYPAGNAGVVGVTATDQADAVASFANHGTDTFIAAPGTSILTLDAAGGTTTVSGTSASAAIVAAAAALLRANDPAASNGTIIGRLARGAAPAPGTGNGRLNLARSLANTSTVPVMPVGTWGSNIGGPFVNPTYSVATADAYTTPGSFQWTAPAGITTVIVEAWGGGGRGGSDTAGNGTRYGGGGGGGGAYSRSTIAVTPGLTYSFTVGAGATTTAAGGDSLFGATICSGTVLTVVCAKGGSSGPDDSTAGGPGGVAGSGIGTTKWSGGTGGSGSTSTRGGGGGSSAGTAANGNAGSGSTAGSAPTGGGAGGSGSSTTSGFAAGSGPGGGGGTGLAATNGTLAGASGAAGKVVLTYVPDAVTAGTATAVAGGAAGTITVSMPFTDDGNNNSTYTVEYKSSTADSTGWLLWANAAHTTSPYTTTITGLAPGASYDIRMTYNDVDGVNGLNTQLVSPVTVAQVTVSVSGNWTAPAKVDTATIELWGGGGAGGGSTATGPSAGGGGAGGQYAIGTVTVVPTTSYPIVIGAGGAGGTGSGAAGADSTFGGTTVVAKGGAGGLNGATSTVRAGGTGSGSGGTGDIVRSGGTGAPGTPVNLGQGVFSGGGGGGAGSLANGNNATLSNPGPTQDEFGGQGGLGTQTTGSGGSATGSPILGYGGGGAGALKLSGSSTPAGGAGAPGFARISYKIPATITFDVPSLTRAANGTDAPTPTATTSPAGLAYTITYNGSSIAPTLAGTYTVVATITDGAYSGKTGGSDTYTITAGAPTTIALNLGTGQSGTVHAPVAVPPSVLVTDTYGSPVAGISVTFAIGSGSGSLTGGSATTNPAGIATVGSWTLGDTAGANTLTATSTGLTGSPVTFTATGTAATAAKLAFGGTPATTTAGLAISPAVAVLVQDQYNNTVTSSSSSVTIGSGTTSFTGSTLTVAAVSGVATFANVRPTTSGASITLTASATGLTGATSAVFTVNAAAPSKLVFGVQPSNVTAGSAITPPVTVRVQDQYSNTVTSDSSLVTIGSSTTSFTPGSTLAVAASGGIATFANLHPTTAGALNTLSATDGSLTPTTSNTFTVTAGIAARLAFGGTPATTTAGLAISPAVTVLVQDQYLNTVTSSSSSVTIGSGTTSLDLASVLTVAAASGVATFANVRPNTSGASITLTASATGLTGATSATFIVNAASPTKLAFGTGPVATTAGNAISPAVTVLVQDQYDNTVTGFATTVTIGSPTTSFDPASLLLATTSGGVATFANIRPTTAGAAIGLTASAPSLTPVSSGTFIVSPAGATQLAFGGTPAATTAGSAISPAVTVLVKDAYGNTVTSDSRSVTIDSSTTLFTGSTLTVTAVSGVATFANVRPTTAGASTTLAAFAGLLTGTTSAVFTVNPSTPSKLAFGQQPAPTTSGTAITPPVTVRVQDQYGNTVTTDSRLVTISSSTTAFDLSSTLAVAASSGVATFSNIRPTTPDSANTLDAAAGGLVGATSDPFTVNLGPPTHLAIGQQPTSIIYGDAISPAVTVRILDAYDYLTSSTALVTLVITTSTGTAGATVLGTATVAAVGGVATFPGVSLSKVGTGYTLDATSSLLASATSTSFNVTARPLAVTALDQAKTYGVDGSSFFGTGKTAFASVGLANGDVIGSVTLTDTNNCAAFKTAALSACAITPSAAVFTTGSAANYATPAYAAGTLQVDRKLITVTADPQTKVYGVADASSWSFVYAPSLVAGDAAFSGRLSRVTGPNVGSYPILQGSLSLSTNYNIAYVGANLVITARPITVTAVTGTRTYDSTIASSGVPLVTGSLAAGDTATWTQTYDSKNVGSGKTLTPAGTVSDGNGGLNYSVTLVTNTTGAITARLITVTADAKTKVYGDAEPTLTSTVTAGSLAGSDVFTGALVRTAGENVGPYPIAQGSLSAGTNYTLTYVGANLSITARPITVTAAAATKTYDGTVSSVATPTITSGSLATALGDTGAWSQTYDTRHVGTAKTFTPVGTISGPGGSTTANYVITFATSATGVITARPITVTAVTGTKAYDGTTASIGIPLVTGAIAAGDTPTWTQTYDTRNVGTGKTLTPAGAVSDGNGGNNYAVTFAPNTTGVIITKPITVTAVTDTKTYDGTNASIGIPLVTGSLVGGDSPGWTQTYNTKNVGTGKTLTPTGAAADGNGGLNYSVTFVPNTTGVINQRPLTVTAVTGTKTYDGTTSSAGTPLVTGSLAPGESGVWTQSYVTKNVGTGKTITPGGTVSAPGGPTTANYAITFTSSTAGEITTRPITVTAVTDTKAYDGTTSSAGPPLVTGSLAPGDTVAWTQTYATKDIGTGKTINAAGTVSDGNGGNNYSVSFVANATGVITALAITVTADAQSKQYGDVDPVLTYSVTSGGLAFGDAITGSLTRDPGETVAGGSYPITKGSLNAGGNYTLAYVGASLSVTPAPATVTPNVGQSKTYGTVDPPIAWTATGILDNTLVHDTVATAISGALGRAVGENVGSYAINSGGLAAPNYNLTLAPGVTFAINARAITVTADAKTKVYGFADPTLTYQVSAGSLVLGDAITGSLLRTAGESIGAYAITKGSLNAGGNYTLGYVGANLTITARPITVTADAKTKVYGDADPALTYSFTPGGLVTGDAFSGSLTRAPGENVSLYAILGGTLSAGGNYTLTYVGASLSITARPITVTAAAATKTYDGTLASSGIPVVTGSLKSGDTVTWTQTYDTKNVGSGKTLTPAGTVSDGNGGNNYTVTFATSATGVINARPITVTAVTGTKAYDGTLASSGLPTAPNGALVGGDTATWTQTYDTKNVGTGKTLTPAGTVSDGNGGNNYAVTFAPNTTGVISTRAITVTAAAQTKMYGDADPTLTYSFTPGGLIAGDAFTGSLTRTAGETVLGGPYAIAKGGLTAGGNYAITYVPANLTITPAPVVVTPDSPQGKAYNAPEPTLTWTASGLVNNDSLSVFTGSLSRAPGTAIGAYLISLGTLSAGPNYTTTLSSSPVNFSIGVTLLVINAVASGKVYGGGEPPLTYVVTGYVNGENAITANLQGAGSCTRSQGETVSGGPYTITCLPGNLTANNYLVVSGSVAGFTISKAPVTLTPTIGLSKTYGAADPPLTFTASPLATGDTVGNSFSGGLGRAAGNPVGTYAINTLGSVISSNYAPTVSLTPVLFTINKAMLTVDAVGNSKTYGAVDPAFTYNLGGLQYSDTASVVSGAPTCSRVSGETAAGPYAISCVPTIGGSPSMSATNYDFAAGAPASFIINPAPITVTPSGGQNKVYGALDPVFTWTAAGVINNARVQDTLAVIVGALSRVAGSNAGAYAITKGSLVAGSNYTLNLSSTPVNFTIQKANVTLDPIATGKVYGSADPALNFNFTGFQNGETILTALGVQGAPTGCSRTLGETVAGIYTITCPYGSLAATNYTFQTGTSAPFTITRAPLIVTPNAGTKVYGASDPTLTSSVSGLIVPDTASVLGGALSRAPGESVAGTPYAITIGTLSAANYTISLAGSAGFSITRAPVTVTPTAGQSKTYGAADPTLLFAAPALVNGDNIATAFTGALTRAAGSSNAGTYAILGTGLTAANYTITFTPGVLFTIIKAPLTVDAVASSKTYGSADPSLGYTLNGFVNGENSSATSGSGTCSRVVGEAVLGGPYDISCTTGGLAATNYSFSAGTKASFVIDPLLVTLTPASGQTKIYGSPDPTLAWSTTPLASGDNVGSVFSGAVARAPGESAGAYAIGLGTLTANSNYSLALAATPVSFTIAPLTLTITPNPGQAMTWGDPAPTLAYTFAPALVNGDTPAIFTGTLNSSLGVGTHPIILGTLYAGGNYTLVLTPTPVNLTVNQGTLIITAKNVTLTYGDTLSLDSASGFTVSGLAFSDSVTSVALGASGAASVPNAGTYPITIAGASGSAGLTTNYAINYIGATLQVNQAPTTIGVSFGTGPTAPYTGGVYGASAQVTGPGGLNVPLSPVYTGECQLPSGLGGASPCTAAASFAGSANYLASSGSATVTILPAPGAVVAPTAVVAPLAAYVTSRTFPLSFSGVAGTYPARSFDIRYRRAAYNGNFQTVPTEIDGIASASFVFTGLAGSTYCFSLRAYDPYGHTTGAWTAETCTAVPLDDRSLSRSSGWLLKADATPSRYFNGTYAYTTGIRKYVQRTSVQARRIAIIATTCSTCGTVKVYWKNKLIKTVSLKSTVTTYHKVIVVATFKSVQSGTLKLVVSTSGKKIYLDGVAVLRV
jgi:hypothetical protein